MILLRNNIFCTSDVLRQIRSGCRSGTGVARKLMHGVFNHERVLDCTLQGRKIYSQGPQRRQEAVRALNNTAREAIQCEYEQWSFSINFLFFILTRFYLILYTFVCFSGFAKKFAKSRGWVIPKDDKINGAMTDELGKLKRSCRERLHHRDEQGINDE